MPNAYIYVFFLITCIISAIAMSLSAPSGERDRSVRTPDYFVAILILAVGLLLPLYKYEPSLFEHYGAFFMVAVGLVTVPWMNAKPSDKVAGLALLGAALFAMLGQVWSGRPADMMIAMTGAVALVAVLGMRRASGEPAAYALSVAVVSMAALLCKPSSTGPGFIGIPVALAASVAVLIATVTDRLIPKAAPRIRGLLIVAVMLGGAWLIAHRWTYPPEAWRILAVPTLAAGIVHWLLPDENDRSDLRMGLAVVVWCALATYVYGLNKAAGIGQALLIAGMTLVALGNYRAMQSLMPLLAIGFYRVFRLVDSDSERAADIAQHYAMIGIALGAVAAVLPLEWIGQHAWPLGRRALAGQALWALLLPVLPALVAIMMGEKGTVGFLIGLGLAPMLARYQDARSLGVVATSSALGCAALLVYSKMSRLLELTRSEKAHYFAYSTGLLVIVAVILWWLGGGAKELEEKTT